MLPKPERVDVGQWWVPKSGDERPWRIEPRHLQRVDGSAEPMDYDWSWLTNDYDYAGSGEHPEPSEWMIETLAKHAYAINYGNDEAMWRSQSAAIKHGVLRLLAQGQPTAYAAKDEAAVHSLYKILRSLGKW